MRCLEDVAVLLLDAQLLVAAVPENLQGDGRLDLETRLLKLANVADVDFFELLVSSVIGSGLNSHLELLDSTSGIAI